MKKILLAALLCLLTLPLSAFIEIPTTGNYDSLLDMFSTGMNSGLATATIPGRIFSAGLQANFAMNDGGGVLENAGNKDNYVFPLLFANLHLGDFLIFARGLAVNQKGADFWYVGGGLGYIVSDYKLLFPQIRLLGAYHMLNASHAYNDVKVSTITVNAVADYKVPVLPIHALANIGYERNMLDASWNALGNSGKNDLGLNRFRFSVGAQVKLLILGISYEYTILPNPNHNVGVSVVF